MDCYVNDIEGLNILSFFLNDAITNFYWFNLVQTGEQDILEITFHRKCRENVSYKQNVKLVVMDFTNLQIYSNQRKILVLSAIYYKNNEIFFHFNDNKSYISFTSISINMVCRSTSHKMKSSYY